ncbi:MULTISPECIES: ABC transporter substrate-binding protein [unclassified Corynebacterium]|uniref:peptide ABC transporter substrate-binding protein n=1 Tax=unclassified Corynebacterium TaxID=2624378 RepID=UPI0029CA723B|nr:MULTISPECIES: ABC transporter substrate-binding protein [unclassified Corynebacterium]WPF66940.1 ABC transporter substrate-binding protein [Corynebacterium sp. 22KM0430]WPF69428.1 ABC transporter substrate-binding protein [Corynebacterium sp. 21KM1197]
MVRRRIIALLAAMSIAGGGLAACGSDDPTDYITASGSEPQNPLLPGMTNETGGGRVIELIYSGLVSYDASGEPYNEVAESIESEDGQHYTIRLKQTSFADGTPVKAQNFVRAWNYAVANSQTMEYAFEGVEGYEEGIEELPGVQVVDDYTFTVALKQVQRDFPVQLGYQAYYPLPDVAFEDMEAFGQNPVGNGPYRVSAWTHYDNIKLVPNEHYRGARQVHNDGVKFIFYATQDAAYADLLANNLDVLESLPDSAFATYEQELEGRQVNQPAAIFQGFVIPERLEHFSGEEGALRRRAISRAINREQITDLIFEGTRTPATDFTSPTIPGHSDDLPGAEVLEYDPEEARRLWAQADAISPWSGEFSLGYNADGGHQAWVDAVTNQLRNTLGIEAVGKPYPDFKSLRDEIGNRATSGAFRAGWQADTPMLSDFLVAMYTTTGGSNDSDYSNAEVDRQVALGKAAETTEEANEHYNLAQEQLLKDLPCIPLWYSNTVGGHSENVSDVSFAWTSLPVMEEIRRVES